MNKEIGICDECGSKFYRCSSIMMARCPECAHMLYDYPSCHHVFVDDSAIQRIYSAVDER